MSIKQDRLQISGGRRALETRPRVATGAISKSLLNTWLAPLQTALLSETNMPRPNSRPWLLPLITALGLWLGFGGVAVAADEEGPLVVPSISDEAPGKPQKPWQFVGLPHQTKPETHFTVVTTGPTSAMALIADHSYGNLVTFGRKNMTNQTTLSWRWLLERPNPLANLRTKNGDDAPAKVCVMFDYDVSTLPFGERAELRLARSEGIGLVPAATLCYVWDHSLPAGTSLVNAFTSRIRYIVLESGEEHLHEWRSESRSVAEDFWRTFGPEFHPSAPDDIPPIVGIAIGADSDNTETISESFITDLHIHD
jgi:hypothetical protein